MAFTLATISQMLIIATGRVVKLIALAEPILAQELAPRGLRTKESRMMFLLKFVLCLGYALWFVITILAIADKPYSGNLLIVWLIMAFGPALVLVGLF